MNLKKTADLLLQLRGNLPRWVVAKAIGVSEASIRYYEQGKGLPGDAVKEKLANYYQMSVQELFWPDLFLAC